MCESLLELLQTGVALLTTAMVANEIFSRILTPRRRRQAADEHEEELTRGRTNKVTNLRTSDVGATSVDAIDAMR